MKTGAKWAVDIYKINPNPNPNPNTNPSSPYCIMIFIFGSRVHVPSRAK